MLTEPPFTTKSTVIYLLSTQHQGHKKGLI